MDDQEKNNKKKLTEKQLLKKLFKKIKRLENRLEFLEHDIKGITGSLRIGKW